jgi:hypothetical protein
MTLAVCDSLDTAGREGRARGLRDQSVNRCRAVRLHGQAAARPRGALRAVRRDSSSDLPADAHTLAGEALWMWANEQAERAPASR